jgi:hypothetical protein
MTKDTTMTQMETARKIFSDVRILQVSNVKGLPQATGSAPSTSRLRL